jgi:hypothetical protein
MAEYEIPSGPLTAEEMREEIETVRRLAGSEVVGSGSRRKQPAHPLRPD